MKKEDIIKIYNGMFKFVFIILFVAFLTLYVSNQTGYFEYQQRQNVILTEEKIKQFEIDVKNGVKLDIEKYLEDTKINYNNKTSKLGLFLSNKLGEYFKNGIEKTFKILNEFVKE